MTGLVQGGDCLAPVMDVPTWAADRLRVFPAAVAPEICDRIIARCLELELRLGSLHNGLSGQQFYDPDFRMTSVGWLRERDWIFDLMQRFANDANREWGFDLNDADHLQYAVYRRHDFFDYHKDLLRIRSGPIRKVSVVLQLDDPENYRGGWLEFLDDDFGLSRPTAFRCRGSVAVFSSLLKHRVTPVKDGERRSLTAWFKGPPFR